MRNLKILFSYLGAYRRDAIIGVFFVSVETVLELFIPVIMANIIDVGVPAGDINYMLLQGAYMLVCAALSLVLGLGYARTSARVALGPRALTCARPSTKRFRRSLLVTWTTTTPARSSPA